MGRARRVEERFEWPLLIAALLTIPAIAIEQSRAGEPYDTIAVILNWVVWLAFLVELVVMLAIVPNRRRWLRSTRWSWRSSCSRRIGFVAILTATAADRFMRARRAEDVVVEHQLDEIIRRLDALEHRLASAEPARPGEEPPASAARSPQSRSTRR